MEISYAGPAAFGICQELKISANSWLNLGNGALAPEYTFLGMREKGGKSDNG